MRKHTLFIFILLAIISSCSTGDKKYRIGVSQCSDDIWRDKQNTELKMAAYFHDNVELKFAAAYDSDERQIQQIDSLVNEGIDLLIVAPNQIATISPAIDRTFEKGIPVIVFERKTNSRKYTAYMGADNYEMGKLMGEYIATRLQGKGKLMEVMGLKGSSPSIERHNGFRDALKDYPQLEVIATLQGDWTEPTAYKQVKEWNLKYPDTNIDLVFGMNDRSAIGARKAFSETQKTLPLFCGIDGLPGKDGGIQQVRDSLLDASYIYPTHGDQILDLAVRILEGKSYEKETMLMSALVTSDNAKVLQMESEEIMRQAAYLDQLHEKADNYLQQLGTQRIVNWLAIGIIALLLAAIVLFYLYHVGKMTLRKERVVNTLWNIKPEDIPVIEGTTEPSKPSDETAVVEQAEESEPIANTFFITRFKEVVESRLEDSELSVEDLASDMNLSRVQLYRKVKAVTGSTPIELLRTARLNRAYQMLMTTDRSVSEIAYQVGFSAPSYFTKCFKEEYGMLPGDVRK